MQREAVTKSCVLFRVVSGLYDGVGDPLHEKVEERPVEPGPQRGEGVVERRGHVVPRAVMRVRGGQNQAVHRERDAARRDAFGDFRSQAGRDREELAGNEGGRSPLAVPEEEGAGMETGPVPARHPARDGVAPHRQARGRREVGLPDTGEERRAGRRRRDGVRGHVDGERLAAGESHRQDDADDGRPSPAGRNAAQLHIFSYGERQPLNRF